MREIKEIGERERDARGSEPEISGGANKGPALLKRERDLVNKRPRDSISARRGPPVAAVCANCAGDGTVSETVRRALIFPHLGRAERVLRGEIEALSLRFSSRAGALSLRLEEVGSEGVAYRGRRDVVSLSFAREPFCRCESCSC